MKIVVTGAGGFLGGYIARQLLDDGHTVFNLSRSEYPNLSKIGITTKKCDVADQVQVREALEGIEGVFHVASKVSMWGRWNDFFATNVTGTQNIIDGCKQHGIQKLVYTSTPSVVFDKNDIIAGDETISYPANYVSMYAKSKAMAEKKILGANNGQSLCTVALRPHLIMGPGDPNLVPRLLEASRQKRLKVVGKRNNMVDVIHVESAARTHIEAFNRLTPGSPICGQTYFLGEESPVNLWDFIDEILLANGQPKVQSKISLAGAYTIGAIIEIIYRVLGIYDKNPPMTRFIALQFAKSHYFNHDKAISDLNFKPRGLSVKDCLACNNKLE